MKLSNIKYFLFFVLLFARYSGLCCMNEYRALVSGVIVYKDISDRLTAPSGRLSTENKKHLLEQLHKVDSIYKITGKLEDYSDYAVMLVYNGEYLRAKAIFIEIESKSPGLYATASNLGTTYELLGQNDLALHWITKAIKINPNSHNGSEWIHVKILEAKIKANGDDKYFLTHNLLSLDFGNSEKPENKNNIDLIKLRSQLYHQLSERMSFANPQDQIVGQLLFDLGNVNAIVMDVKSGLEVYEVAKKYGFSSPVLIKREKHFISLQNRAKMVGQAEDLVEDNLLSTFLIFLTLFVSFIAGIRYLIKRFKKQKL